MPTPRKQQISLSNTNYYHCVSRCTRRAFLFGRDQFSGQDYNHRRDWVEERILFLGQVFAIEVAAFSVMSNHHHLVLRIDTEKANNWSLDEVIEQWHKIYNGTFISRQYLAQKNPGHTAFVI